METNLCCSGTSPAIRTAPTIPISRARSDPHLEHTIVTSIIRFNVTVLESL